MLASFHGDTNGLASVPVLGGVHAVAQSSSDRSLIFGLDANTYEHPGADKQGIAGFAQDFLSKGMNSCWGPAPEPQSHTTCNARTFLQPQLNKACHAPTHGADGLIGSFPALADVNLKDYILFYSTHHEPRNTIPE